MDLLLDKLDSEDLVPLSSLFTMILCTAHLQDEILVTQRAQHCPSEPPATLPPAIIDFLTSACSLTTLEIVSCWGLIKNTVWTDSVFIKSLRDPKGLDDLFREHGTPSKHSIFPLVRHCNNPDCSFAADSGHKLQTAGSKQVILYTLCGPLPVMEVHFTCRSCKTAYYPNYFTKQAQRIYYDEISQVIQISDHRYADEDVIRNWTLSMNNLWASADSCANTYVKLHKKIISDFPEHWIVQPTLLNKHVYDGFTILALWQDHSNRRSTLIVPHDGDQAHRFTAAMRARTDRIRTFGHSEVRHYCEKCVRRFPATPTRGMSAAYHTQAFVGDGVSVTRRRCKESSCRQPLAHNRSLFCPSHSNEPRICAIVGCSAEVVSGKKTCAIKLHQQVEQKHFERGKALFQLGKRHEQNGFAYVRDNAVIDEETDLAVLVEEEEDGTEALRALFGGSYTHNEQLVFAPCGMIIVRDTFYNAEGISSMAACISEMLERITFQRDRMPEYFVYDNNCSLSKHVKGNSAFDGVGLPVDVFHFKSKHSIKDTWCQSHCNPAGFPDLIKEGETGWWFNTSIAEQTNAWFGRFKTMTQAMHSDRFDFFLDQMIIMRNEDTREKLELSRDCPSYV
ncbi:hypothetical protein C8J56DRAFT_768806 [Mycena floridula]|nr:hypothetical protein C8J56DRAFT_768806 [Mycena floridula]